MERELNRGFSPQGETTSNEPTAEQIKRQPIKRLEKALKLWEQECFFRNAEHQTVRGVGKSPDLPLEGPLLHYESFRQCVLRSYAKNEPFDEDKYCGTDIRTRNKFGPLGHVPRGIYEWNRYSRRAFNLSADISAQLLHTDLDGILWSDVKLPFEAYVMQLEEPIRAGNTDVDFILVHRIDNKPQKALAIALLPTVLDELPIVGDKYKERMNQLINNRRWRRLAKKLTEAPLIHIEFPYVPLEYEKADFAVTDVERIIRDVGQENEDSPDDKEILRQALRLVVSFALYLKQIPSENLVQSLSTGINQPPTPDITAITEAELINFVTSSHPLTNEQRGSLTGADGPFKGGYEMRWHWRRGYYSRRPGEGNNPNAPKIVWHPPMEIRKDRKPPNIDSIPGGSITLAE